MGEEARMFPRWFYKPGAEPKLVASEEEAAALGEGWSDEAPQGQTGRAMPHGVEEQPPGGEREPPSSEEGGEPPRRRR